MPKELFQPNAATHTAIAIFKTNIPHNNKEVLFYDLKGNPMYVRYLGDFTFSTLTTNPLMTRTTTLDYDFYFLEQKALNISGITFTQAEIDQISGFSIV